MAFKGEEPAVEELLKALSRSGANVYTEQGLIIEVAGRLRLIVGPFEKMELNRLRAERSSWSEGRLAAFEKHVVAMVNTIHKRDAERLAANRPTS